MDLSESIAVRGVAQRLGAGEVDMAMNFIGPLLMRLDALDPIVMLAGGHVGCFELIGSERIRSIRDVKGKRVALADRVTSYVFLDSLLGYVGFDARKDLEVPVHPPAESIRLLAERKVDAFLAFPPFTQELRAKKIGHVVASFATDRPWSQYFCCLLAGNREFVRKNPIATKRTIRAVLKAADMCALEPERGARVLAERMNSTQSDPKRSDPNQYDYALQLMKDLPYGK